jgi:O-methyltransferase involved in polyketide biosynthesis
MTTFIEGEHSQRRLDGSRRRAAVTHVVEWPGYGAPVPATTDVRGALVTETSPAADQRPVELDTTVAHSARLWNYLLGGKDNFAADREAAAQVLAFMPELVQSARFNREFLGRAVRHLAGPAGIRQFLDVGTGLPTADNTHEVAQATAAASRIVYVDNDPMVLVHARALLNSSPEGATDYIDADVRDPDRILAQARRTLDFDRPVAVMLLGILNFVVDDDEARRIVRRLVDAVPAGSYLVISHPTREVNAEAVDRAVQMWNAGGSAPMTVRSPQEIGRFFDGLELLEPGLVSCSAWRPEGNDTTPVSEYCAVARKNG